MHAAVVALSELHEAVFAVRMTRTFGVLWEARKMGRDRNLMWAITAVTKELVAEFSTSPPAPATTTPRPTFSSPTTSQYTDDVRYQQ